MSDDGYPELEAMTGRLCKLMGWEAGKAHKFEIIRQTMKGNAAALSVEKGNQIADRLEMYRKRCEYLEARIKQLSLYGGHIHIKDYGDWKTVHTWAEEVMRGD